MKDHSIHKNLDTSFVNVSALVRYLRRRQFVGSVRVELSGYEAEIHLDENNALRVREFDRITGRVGEGEEALQRILIRSREPGGIVNVFQTVESEEKIVEVITEKPAEKVSNTIQNIKPTAVLTVAAPTNGTNGNAPKPEPQKIVAELPKPKNALPTLPLDFTNKVESKAKQNALSTDDWELLLNLTSELLSNIDKTLKTANLDFSAAFTKARTEISGDYPFINPETKIFNYKDGKISMREQQNAKLFTASVLEALRRLLDKLGANPKFTDVHRAAIQKILMLVHHRRAFYDKFSMTKPLEKLLGV
ncbi:MAG TPA: hypothetical protein PKE69_16345 [Pyrinomonadaceae bacterium]|nr:hypothetical protein [Pyrinomonadaceae bacterium]